MPGRGRDAVLRNPVPPQPSSPPRPDKPLPPPAHHHEKQQKPNANAAQQQVAQALLEGNHARPQLQHQRGGRGGRGRGRGGKGKGGAAPAAVDVTDAAPPPPPPANNPYPVAAPAAEPPPPPPPPPAEPTAEELAEAEAEAKRKLERKAAKKARRSSQQGATEGGGVDSKPVLPPEPAAGSLTGIRTCQSPSDFCTLCQLGQGAFGRVMLVRWKGDGSPWAMKVVRLDEATLEKPAALMQLLVERRVLTELSSEKQPQPLLASCQCCFRSRNHLHFVMPFLQGGTLGRLLDSQPKSEANGTKTLSEASTRFYIAQVALALGALHSRGMLYLDLKLENVMLSSNGDAVLVDFGFVRCDIDIANGQTVKRAGGTRCYLAPEAILSQPVSSPCDWWALGVLAFELLVGYLPFCGENDKVLGKEICNSRVRFPRELRNEGSCTDLTSAGAPAGAPASSSPSPSPAPADASASSPEAAPSAAAPGAISPDAVAMVRKLLAKKPEARLCSKGGVDELKAQPFFGARDFPIDWVALANGTHSRPDFEPILASDVDVRYFDRKHTSLRDAPVSVAEADAAGDAEAVRAQAASEARKAEFKRAEETRQAQMEEERRRALDSHRAAATKAVEDAKAKEVREAEEAVAEAQKRVKNLQKKLRQSQELQELQESRRAAGESGGLNKEQKEKVKSIPAMKAELDERTQEAEEMERGLEKVRQKLAAEEAKAAEKEKEEKGKREAEAARRMEKEAEEAERKRKEKAVDAGNASELRKQLAVDVFGFVGPGWR